MEYALLFAQPAETLGDGYGPTLSVLEHFMPRRTTVQQQQGTYALRCGATQRHAAAVIDGTERMLACQGMDRRSSIFKAATVELQAAPAGQAGLKKPRRYTLQ